MYPQSDWEIFCKIGGNLMCAYCFAFVFIMKKFADEKYCNAMWQNIIALNIICNKLL